MAVNKIERWFVPKSNSSLRVDRCCMTSTKLILNTGITESLKVSFISISSHLLLDCLSSNQKCNLIWPKDFKPLHGPEYMCNSLKKVYYDLRECQIWLLASYATVITSLVYPALECINRVSQSKLLSQLSPIYYTRFLHLRNVYDYFINLSIR
jgi:hypothetical protein